MSFDDMYYGRSQKSSQTVRYTGISFSGMLTVLFVGLKLTGYIDWSWWWVVSPLWISLLIDLGILAVIGIVLLIAYLMDK